MIYYLDSVGARTLTKILKRNFNQDAKMLWRHVINLV